MAADSLQRLSSLGDSVTTSSTNLRISIFRHQIPDILRNSEISGEVAAVLVDIIFKTLCIYDDLRSRKAVDNVVLLALAEVTSMKAFAACLVQYMEKQQKSQSDVGSYRLLKWSCFLLTRSEFASISKTAVSRVVAAQSFLLHTVLKGSFREKRACKRLFFHLFSKYENIFKTYIGELKDGRIPYKDYPDLIWLLIEFSRNDSSFGQYKPMFLDLYVKSVLSAREKPAKSLVDAFCPLFLCLTHDEFGSIVVPSSVKMLKRNPEIALESVEVLLKAVTLDLSKYAMEILPMVLTQARHADEGRRLGALAIMRCLSQKSSNPDVIEGMYKSVKSVIGGSEGRLQFPYQRVGMFNALQELSHAPGGKMLNDLSTLLSGFLLSCYKDDGNEEVKLGVLSALASWLSQGADTVQPTIVSFFSSGLKEKETLRRAHLRCLRVICKNSEATIKLSSLLAPLIQIVKTGYTKSIQRIDSIYALLLVAKIAAVDIKAEETVVKEKTWSLIAQQEPSVIPVSLVSKLSDEDCLACVDLLHVLVVDHTKRMLDAFSVQSLFQVLFYLLCHQSWEIRKAAYGSTRSIVTAVPQTSESLLNEFAIFLSAVAESRLYKTSEIENAVETPGAFVPSVEVMVKALVVLSSTSVSAAPETCGRIIFCSHHPALLCTGKRDGVWRRISTCLKTNGFDVLNILAGDIRKICEDLMGSAGLSSSSPFEQQAAVDSLCTLMSIAPSNTYVEFEKHLRNLPDRYAHDALSQNDIQVFNTPEGTLSTEVGVYVASREIDEQGHKEHSISNNSVRRDVPRREASGVAGKKDISKTAKKIDKGKSAKEEARELLLREEASIREKVKAIQSNLSIVLKALGEMAVANPIFTHSELSSMVKFVEPLIRSPIVGDKAYETLVKLSTCIAPPLCNWALDIATALRLICLEESHNVLDLISAVDGEESSEKPLRSVFDRAVHGLSSSSTFGPLPVDTFIFAFPIMEWILLSPKKTALHDKVLRVLYLHTDPVLPLPRLRMLSVLYHVLGVIPAYQAAIGSTLNELCLGLKLDDVASALYGVYAKDLHVRMACLNAVKCIPAVSGRCLVENVEIATSIWMALHDPEKSIAEAAEDLWDRYGFDFGTDYSRLYKALAHVNYNVRLAAAEALAAALDEYPDTIQECLATLFSLYIRDAGFEGHVDAGWLARQGVALALNSAADVLKTKDLPVVMTFLISRALADPNGDVRGRMINAGILIIDKHGRDNVSLLFPIFENYLNKKASDEETYDLVREGVVIFTGALAKHLAKDDPKVHTVVEKLLEVLNTPSEAVQRAVSSCLSPLMLSKQEDGAVLVSRLLSQMMKSDKYGERRGAAFGLAGVVKGFGISSLKKYGIATALHDGLTDRASAKCREGALLGFECLCEKLGKLFEPYVIQMLPLILVSFSDQVTAVREAAECAARAMMANLTAQGVKLVLPSLLRGLEDKAWRTKQSSVQLLGAMAYCAPQQLSQCLPKIVPKLTEVLTDTHPKVQSAGQTALQQVGEVIKNPEIASLVPTLLTALTDPNDHTKYALDTLLQTTFVNSIDAPSLALLVPIVHRGLRERSAETKKKAAQIVGNMCSLVTEPNDMIPYTSLLLPEVKKVLLDPIPEVRSVAARAIGSLIKGMGEENFPDLVPWLLETLKSDGSNVERSGAAQGLSEVLAALGIGYFEQLLPDIIRNCSHQKAHVREGYLTVFKYLPRSLGVQFQNYLQQVLPAILDGLADENESVRDAALSAGHVLVEHYAATSLPLLLPAVEDGIFNDSWRIRQSSVELLGDLLFKVAGTSGKALLEGGSDDEGASTEAQGRAIIEVLGKEKRNEVLAALYMVRTDVSVSVRQAALHVWKTIVANTPKTLKEIMPVLMDTLISSLASPSNERRQVAARSLGELVRKLGERVLPLIIPILSRGLKDPDSGRRQGVCIGLSEVMACAGRSQLLSFMNELIPTIRDALCDSMPEVRESAGLAFSTLYKSAGLQAIDEIVPTLLHALEDDETSDTALDGLKQILSVRTTAVLPHILPKLVQLPLSEFNAHALGALADVAGAGLNSHLSTVLPALLSAMGDSNVEVRDLSKKAAETVVSVIDDEGIESLISELVKGSGDSKSSIRKSSSYLIGYLFKNSKLYLDDEAPDMISTLVVLLSDSDPDTVLAAWEALSCVVSSLPKEVLPSYIKLVRDAVSTARDKERRKKKGGPVLVPGFCLRKALQPVLPIFLQGLISGSAELREQAALGLGELIEVTSEQALKEFVIPITGPLIRIIGDRFPWQVKSAILSTLTIMIKKGGMALKPFLPQLQTTFIKCLQDNTRTVRSSAALALGKLSALSSRVDPLVSDLLSSLQASDGGVREAVLTALRGVVKHAGKSVSVAVRTRVYDVLKNLIDHEDDQVRASVASILGITSEYIDESQLEILLEEQLDLAVSSSWTARHGSVLTISSMLRHSPSRVCESSYLPTLISLLKDKLKDDKFPVRESSTKALGRYLLYQIQSEPLNSALLVQTVSSIVSALRDDSSEVRRRALSALKAAAKENPVAIMGLASIFGPTLAECLKDSSTPVRLAAERCALHSFQLAKATENVQAAQKYITGLDARRLAKYPEDSDGDGDSEDDNSSS
ncbi:protein ILITYHIA [Silene latifolia]|uniref:protein ILITYHIA n=1 Tax=Silene latifolia TaxID=37657 RepID=UPI003D777F80